MKRKFTTLFWQHSLLALLCAILVVTPACNFSTGLEEAGKFIAETQPFVDLIPAFVCPFNAVACAAVEAAEAIADPAMADVSKFFNDWSTAAVAAQPGILNQILAAVQTAQADQATLISAAKVENTAAQTKINGIASSLEAAMGDLITLLNQAKAGGGTTAALAKVLEEATPVWETESPVVVAAWVANPLRVFASADTLKLKSGQKVHTYHYHKAKIKSVLAEKTHDPTVDKISAAKLKIVKGL